MFSSWKVPGNPAIYPSDKCSLRIYYTLKFEQIHSIFVCFLGVLAAPANLKVLYINTTAIHLRWNAPFSLQNISGTNKPDILGYHLEITNQNTANVTRVNTTTTEYFLLVDGDCITYEARVRAINVVGKGNLSESVTMTSLGGKGQSVYSNV